MARLTGVPLAGLDPSVDPSRLSEDTLSLNAKSKRNLNYLYNRSVTKVANVTLC